MYKHLAVVQFLPAVMQTLALYNADGWTNNGGWPTSTALDEEWESCFGESTWNCVTGDDTCLCFADK